MVTTRYMFTYLQRRCLIGLSNGFDTVSMNQPVYEKPISCCGIVVHSQWSCTAQKMVEKLIKVCLCSFFFNGFIFTGKCTQSKPDNFNCLN